MLDVLLANPTHCFGDVELQALSAIRWQMHLLAVRGAPGGRVAAARLEYRGHIIDVQSHESDGKQWRPKAVVSIYSLTPVSARRAAASSRLRRIDACAVGRMVE